MALEGGVFTASPAHVGKGESMLKTTLFLCFQRCQQHRRMKIGDELQVKVSEGNISR
jgi:hypothetical protein